jgi:hypothetical protein
VDIKLLLIISKVSNDSLFLRNCRESEGCRLAVTESIKLCVNEVVSVTAGDKNVVNANKDVDYSADHST